jgi:hypothetical protein
MSEENNIIAGDIDLDKIGKGRTVHECADSIFHAFNRALVRLVTMGKNKTKKYRTAEQTDSLERIGGMINIVTYEFPAWCIARSYKHLMSQEEYIVNRDHSFYSKDRFVHLVKPDERQQMALDLLSLVEMAIHHATEDELNEAWDLIFVMLYSSTKFKKHIDETHINYGQ